MLQNCAYYSGEDYYHHKYFEYAQQEGHYCLEDSGHAEPYEKAYGHDDEGVPEISPCTRLLDKDRLNSLHPPCSALPSLDALPFVLRCPYPAVQLIFSVLVLGVGGRSVDLLRHCGWMGCSTIEQAWCGDIDMGSIDGGSWPGAESISGRCSMMLPGGIALRGLACQGRGFRIGRGSVDLVEKILVIAVIG